MFAIKLVRDAEPVDKRSECDRNGHRFEVVAVPNGKTVKYSLMNMINVSSPFVGDLSDPIVIPVYCYKCGEIRKLVY